MEMKLRPIGVIHTNFKEQKDTPIQGIFSKAKGKVEVFKRFEEGLSDITGFDYIILIYYFHKTKRYNLKVKPYLDSKLRGLFTTRAPARPNPIGISVVKLLKRKKNILYVSEIDILDKTPLLDIKPYVAKFDIREAKRFGWLSKAKVRPCFADRRFEKIC